MQHIQGNASSFERYALQGLPQAGNINESTVDRVSGLILVKKQINYFMCVAAYLYIRDYNFNILIMHFWSRKQKFSTDKPMQRDACHGGCTYMQLFTSIHGRSYYSLTGWSSQIIKISGYHTLSHHIIRPSLHNTGKCARMQ